MKVWGWPQASLGRRRTSWTKTVMIWRTLWPLTRQRCPWRRKVFLTLRSISCSSQSHLLRIKTRSCAARTCYSPIHRKSLQSWSRVRIRDSQSQFWMESWIKFSPRKTLVFNSRHTDAILKPPSEKYSPATVTFAFEIKTFNYNSNYCGIQIIHLLT